MATTEKAEPITVGMTVEWTNDNELNYDGPMEVTGIDDDLGLVHIDDQGWTPRPWVRPAALSR